MAQKRFQALGPLLAGEGSRAFLGLEHTPDGRASPVVLVWVPDEAEKDASLLDRIRRETEHAAKLEHPNIVRVAGFAHLDEGHARVVEFADGESLRKLLDLVGRVPVRYAARIVADAAMGVHYAHLAGNDDGSPLLHGDLRPETMLISFTGFTKVTGYGALAFAPREHGGQRVKGRRVHTAPEQIIGGRGAMTLPTDVYLLGLTLYECLAGKLPYVDAVDFDQAVLTEPMPPAPDDIPGPIWQVISRACAKKAPDRYSTALEFKDALEAALGELPTTGELAAYLKTVYPESDSVRAARRQAIDAGIADMVRKQWAEKQQAPGPAAPAPQAPAAAAPPRAAPPAAPAPAPKAPAAQPARPAPKPALAQPARPARAVDLPPEEPSYPPPQPSSRTPVIAIGLGVVVVLSLVMAQQLSNAPTPATRRFAEAGFDAGRQAKPPPLPTPEPVDAGETQQVDAAPDAGEAVAVPTPTPTPDPTPPPPPPPPAPDFGVLELDMDPPVEVFLDDKLLGRTPIKVRVPTGRKTFRLVNKDQGVSTARTFTITGGETTTESVRLGKGYVQLSAPEGAQVFIDGRRIGSAPIRGEIPVFAGSHKLEVTIGNAKWNEAFSVREGQRVSFNVQMQ